MIRSATDKRRLPLLRWWRPIVIVSVALALYPAFVVGATYAIVLDTALPGGRNGPKDAYRHTLASAIVAYTGSPRWVEWTTAVMENDGHGDVSRAMDAHNNRLGARIGAEANSWSDMRAAVVDAVANGAVQADDPDRITWLPRERWRDRLY